MNNYLVLIIFFIVGGGSNFLIHRYLMKNWSYYRHLQKNPSPIELGMSIVIMNAWLFVIVLVLIFFFGDEWLL